MNSEDKRSLIKLYEDRCERFGSDVRAVGWGDVESQALRFEVLSDIADLSGCSVCDLGCGFGDLYAYLQGRFDSVNYHGVDLCEGLIKEARKKYPSVSFEVRDALEHPSDISYDYILSSGALSYKTAGHESYVKEMLALMMKMSRKGVAVNFLSSHADYELEKNFHFSPETALTIGKQLAPYVTIRHDYPLYEFTMYMYHHV